MFILDVNFNDLDQDTIFIEAADVDQAKQLFLDTIAAPDDPARVNSIRVIHVDDLPEGETFWSVARN
jgi:hypothetical protein